MEDEFSIHIQDNSSDERTQNIVTAIGSDRVSYERNAKQLSLLENWRKALTHVDSEYFIRFDDDCVALSNFGDFMRQNLEADLLYGMGYAYASSGLYATVPDDTALLNHAKRDKLIEAEYYGLFDTNYCRYRTSAVENVVGRINQAYKYSLPDRYLNYSLLQNQNINILYKSDRIGISRFDRIMASSWTRVKYFDAEAELQKPNLISADCQTNFAFLRSHTASKSLALSQDERMEAGSFLNSKSLAVTSLYGALNDLNVSFRGNKFNDLFKIYFSILKLLCSRKSFLVDGRGKLLFSIICTRRFLIKTISYIVATKVDQPTNVGQFSDEGNCFIDSVINDTFRNDFFYQTNKYFEIFERGREAKLKPQNEQ